MERIGSSSKWVSALNSTSVAVNTLPSCVCLSDLYGDGDYKLVIGDFGTEKYDIRLKVFRGLQLIGENVLSDLPSAIVSFNNENVSVNIIFIYECFEIFKIRSEDFFVINLEHILSDTS